MRFPLYPILSCEQSRTRESRLLTSPEMEKAALWEAGQGIGRQILSDYSECDDWPESPNIWLLAGKGHNTGDALVAIGEIASYLEGVALTVIFAEEGESRKPLVEDAYTFCREKVVTLEEMTWKGELPAGQPDLIVDGLLGLSFKPPLRDWYSTLIKAVNDRAAGMKVAIDLPSGLGADGELCCEVDFTYCAGTPKAEVIHRGGHPAAGRIRFIPVSSLSEDPSDEETKVWWDHNAYQGIRAWRKARSSKTSHGHVLIVAGSITTPGAALMCATAAVQSGAGLVTAISPANITNRLAPMLPEVMWQPVPFTPEGGIDNDSIRALQAISGRGDSLLIGPGLRFDKPTQFAVCRMVRETQLPMVLDASALYQDVMAAVWGRPDHKIPVVITPHEGEYQRLIGNKADVLDEETLLNFARKHSMIVVVKGAVTRVCDGERIYHLATGGPVLARGGTGDILAGMLASRVAVNPDRCLEAVLETISWHGAAGEYLARERGQIAVRTTELLPALGEVLRDSTLRG